jgi:predicted nucleotidyltransferase
LLALARAYADGLARRMPLVAVAVVGSVARGDFNVWSDVDVLVVAEHLPDRAPERAGLLLEGAPAGVQPVGFTPTELAAALRARNPLVVEALDAGVVLIGADIFEELAASS